jgi:hypothetical protein
MTQENPMLRQLRAEALALIDATPDCILSTIGPAGVQASAVTCAVHAGCIYMLVPSTIDQLFNIEHELEVVLTGTSWQLRGAALAIGEATGPRGTAPDMIQARARAACTTLVEVFPLRMHLKAVGQRQYRETIDFAIHC